MELIMDIAYSNLLSPMILFFLAGIIAVVVNSDLKVPEAFYAGYTMIILFTIGIKGGVSLRDVPFVSMLPAAFAGILLSFVMVAIAYNVIKRIFAFSTVDSLAVSAHYGSVSAVTFIAGLSFLEKMKIPYESYISAILIIMEGPGIIAAIVLYKLMNGKQGGAKTDFKHVLKEAFFGKSIFLLLCGLIIGLVAHQEGLAKIKPLFGDLFYGVLCIFLLHMGMIATQSIKRITGFKLYSFAFAFLLPIIGGTLGVLTAHAIGMSIGGTFMIATLTASASYIAAPAAIEQAMPEANPGVYLGASLGLTLPFNLIIGIPFYFWLANIAG